MTRIPFFHYTSLDNLERIINERAIRSRRQLALQGRPFDDISIDPSQSKRKDLGLVDYVPTFAGFYAGFREPAIYDYLRDNYDEPRVHNPSFYGSLNKVLQFSLKQDYEKVVILLIDDALVYDLADHGRIRLFSDIAVKWRSEEIAIANRGELQSQLSDCVNYGNINCEVDLLDNGADCISYPKDIKMIIVDNAEIETKVWNMMDATRIRRRVWPKLLVSRLPRNPLE